MNRLASALLAAATIGCGGAAGTKIADSEPLSPPHDPTAEIAQLWTQIRGWRSAAGLEPSEPSASVKAEAMATALPTPRSATCPGNQQRPATSSKRCRDVCNLANAICDNATRICELSRDLPNNAWARDKCASAKASCHQARKRCCQCRD